ncbi:hypothetical protein OF83DRAFT_1103179 [Amylostereum chailletii]|nr:hypothetical protein OF83DRAFT_1103179 [Amylostereum chailletii]
MEESTHHSVSPSEDSKAITVAVAPSDALQVPLSFPAILRNSSLSSRLAHLDAEFGQTRPKAPPAISRKNVRRDDNEGKRWVRRKENALFNGNPYVAAPSKRDMEPMHAVKNATFPVPLPPYLPRNVSLPPTTVPESDKQMTQAGQFGRSKRGMRKDLRRAGPRTQALVQDVEEDLLQWLEEGEVVIGSATEEPLFDFPGRAVGGHDSVREVQRMPGRLVWWIEDDSWARYVVHCCARYHDVVSFSKDTASHRLTYILRPNNTRANPRIPAPGIVTPPSTDADLSSLSSYDSDILSLSDVQTSADGLSDIASEPDVPAIGPLSDIASDAEAGSEMGSIASLYRATVNEAGAWSADSDRELERATQGLSLGADDDTPRARRAVPYRTRVWERTRSGSSPSRSPARRVSRRLAASSAAKSRKGTQNNKSFYDYLFA